MKQYLNVPFIREVCCSEGAVGDEAFEDTLNIEVCVENMHQVEISDNHAEVMKHRRPSRSDVANIKVQIK